MKPYILPLLEPSAIKELYSIRALLMDLILLFKSLIIFPNMIQCWKAWIIRGSGRVTHRKSEWQKLCRLLAGSVLSSFSNFW